MYWEYKSFGKNWGMPAQKQPKKSKNLNAIFKSPEDDDNDHLLRTYLPHVAGELEESKFNATTGYFSATYYAVPGG